MDADHPENRVLIPRRFTVLRRSRVFVDQLARAGLADAAGAEVIPRPLLSVGGDESRVD